MFTKSNQESSARGSCQLIVSVQLTREVQIFGPQIGIELTPYQYRLVSHARVVRQTASPFRSEVVATIFADTWREASQWRDGNKLILTRRSFVQGSTTIIGASTLATEPEEVVNFHAQEYLRCG